MIGPISTPENAHSSAASVNVSAPAKSGEMPTSRAPARFTAVARSALPYSVRPKKSASAPISARLEATTSRLCTLMFTPAIDSDADENAGVREPSAPKNHSPRPSIVKCSATETISSTSTLASASGWYATRYSSGPSAVTVASVSSTWTKKGSCIGASHHTSAATKTGAPIHSARRPGSRCAWPRCTHPHASMRPAMTAMPTSTFSVPGAAPFCRPASVSVPQATNSPAGIQTIRVTVKTSTSASASSA